MYEIGDRELERVRQVLASGNLFRYQKDRLGECDHFEREFSERIGVAHSLLVTSGTSALVAALGAAGVGPGDEVIVPSYTFVATPMAVLQVGAIPVIADIDESLGISPASVRARLTSRTRAIIPVHMDGLPSDLASLETIAREANVAIIEDVAQAIGGSFQGRRLGSRGALGCFSLNQNKNISCGEGGILTTSRRDLFERAFCFHDGAAQFNPIHRELFREISPFLGGSMRVSEITGALMRAQLERLDGILVRLRERKKIWIETLSDLPGVRTIGGNCADGDCGSSLHLLFEGPELAIAAQRALVKIGLLFAPPSARPAHVSWKWSPYLGARATGDARTNPYRIEARDYPTSEVIQTVSILTRTLKYDIEYGLPLTETRALAERVRAVLRSPYAG